MPISRIGVVAPLPLEALLVAIVVGCAVILIAVGVVVLRALSLPPIVLVAFAIAERVELVLGVVGMLNLRGLPLLGVVVPPLFLRSRCRWRQEKWSTPWLKVARCSDG